MRVTFVLKSAGMEGGVRVVAIYAEALRRAGHDVTVVSTPTPVGSLKRRVKRLFRGEGFGALRPVGPTHLDGCGVDHRVIDAARPVTAEDVPDADVVVATWWETAEWVAGFPPSKGSPVYFIQHDERVFPFMDAPQRARVERTWAMPMAKVVVAQWLADLLESHGCGPVVVIPNAVDTAMFHAPPRGKQPVPTVGLTYSPVGFKGTDVMLNAVRIAQRALPELRVVAFGHNAPVPELPMPANTTYHRHPAQSRIAELYGSCDAWLFGSRCEGFGLPILEAMACRTPVIGTPAGAAPELLAGGRGVPVPMADASAMAEAIRDVATMPEDQWKQMSDRAHAHAAGYPWSHAAECFVAELERAAGREQPTPTRTCR